MENCSACLEDKDFEGAELLLIGGLEAEPRYSAFFHYQLGRLYRRWNKLTSAINHLNLAVDFAHGDEILLIQILDELKTAKDRQLNQRP